MKAALLALVLLTGVGVAIPARAPIRSPEHEATTVLGFSDGTCSATAVGADLILTATHCFEGGPLQAVGTQRCTQVGAGVSDGNDHTIIRVSCKQWKWAVMDGHMYVGQQVHWWGYPGGLSDIYRRGYVMGYEQGWTLTDARVFSGDSGSGIFDRRGKLVGVVSTMFSYGETFNGMGSKPLKFSAGQLEGLGL